MAACVVLTLPLELVFGARVWRRGRRLLQALLPTLAIFLVWDAFAIAREHWKFSDAYTTGWHVLFDIPVEEVAFFCVIPVCGLLTFEAVRHLLPDRDR